MKNKQLLLSSQTWCSWRPKPGEDCITEPSTEHLESLGHSQFSVFLVLYCLCLSGSPLLLPTTSSSLHCYNTTGSSVLHSALCTAAVMHCTVYRESRLGRIRRHNIAPHLHIIKTICTASVFCLLSGNMSGMNFYFF